MADRDYQVGGRREGKCVGGEALRRHTAGRIQSPPPPHPHPPEEEFGGRERSLKMPGAALHEGEPLPPFPPPGPPPLHDPFSIAPRISLFDDGQKLIAGNASAPQEEVLKAIELDGETVGWLGIKKRTQLSRPLDVEFAYQQTRVFFLTGVVA